MTYRDLLAALELAQLWRRKADDARRVAMYDDVIEYEERLDLPIVDGDVEFLNTEANLKMEKASDF
jgi:hypothetical protein